MRQEKSRIIAVVLSVILLSFSFVRTSAFSREDHDKYMNNVLFKSFKIIENDKSVADEIEALECASYLTIDQFNGGGQNELDTLKKYDVGSIPVSIQSIDYSGNAYHRKATHRGWNAELIYENDTLERWKIRKQILVSTVDKIFDFKGDNKKQDSFCALIYYIHVLGDRLADEKYYPNYVIMELGGRPDEDDIVHELIKNIEILFQNQKKTYKYKHVISKLKTYNSKIYDLLKDNKGIIEGEAFTDYHNYAKDIMEVLECNIPEMLKNEAFFREVFYK